MPPSFRTLRAHSRSPLPALRRLLPTLPLLLTYLLVGSCVPFIRLNRPDPLMRPSPPMREFRGLWVATVSNIDWPSRPALPADQQKDEMRAILARAAELHFNAIILQVRPACDALYPSALEPWSEYLTGRQGTPPDPPYDPLQSWIDEAHARGLELHAWFNPYRARLLDSKSPADSSHISVTHPDLVKPYGKFLWLDPGEPAAAEHTLAVFMDVVRRYDIDGVHIDDYFYPYPVPNVDFPDEPSWRKYLGAGGTLSRNDWRRDNINRLIERIYRGIKQEKTHVKFGISPFGIWKPGYPANVKGFNQYESLYADARLWLNQGWCDYFTPQLYWQVESPGQPYPDLLDWWIGENRKHRHLWPGIIPSRVGNAGKGWAARDILDQIALTRIREGSTGIIHFSAKPIMENRGNLADALRSTLYAQQSLVPNSPWLDGVAPPMPKVTTETIRDGMRVYLQPRGKDSPFLWVVYARYGMDWRYQIIPGHHRDITLPADPVYGPPNAAAASAVGQLGDQSPLAYPPQSK